ncbi:MAG: filamentous hemagglutinin N-terminal domain-containing protein, partial [Prochlorotrichaceae cyanobacterium]
MSFHPATSKVFFNLLKICPWVLLLEMLPVKAQPITADGTTPTEINQTGNQIDISGGTIAGPNQFHSFDQFGVPSGNTANFQAPQPVENVMGRVTGGNPSVIDGTVKVSGADANLYLMNPAGMVFGKDAQLDVPGSFNATSATGIGFDSGGEFSATGSNNYDALVGSPNSFNFDRETGDIVNHGNLAVPTGKNLNLVGDTVESTGSLSAPGGSVNVIAVPGDKNRVRIQQAGMVLELDVQTDNGGVSPTQLPRYLTGGDGHANTLQVDENGRVRLTRQPKGTAAIVGTPEQPAQITGDRIRVVGENTIINNARLQSQVTGRNSIDPLTNLGHLQLEATTGRVAIVNSQARIEDVVGIGGVLNILGRQIRVDGSQIQIQSNALDRSRVRIESRSPITIATPTGTSIEDTLARTTLQNTQVQVLTLDRKQVGGRVEVLSNMGTISLLASTLEGFAVYIGGDFQGQGTLPTAQVVQVDEASIINASGVPLDASGLPALPDSPIPPLA